MTFFRQKLGRKGEEEALRLLKKEGYKLIERNFRGKSGEIDLIARDGETLAFVEVKARSSERFGSPKEAVDRRKREHIIKTSLEYLAKIGAGDGDYDIRYDVVSVLYGSGGSAEVEMELIKNAFGEDGL